MAFIRIKANGWTTNQKLTSSQLNQLDIDHTNALDKTGDNVAGGGGISGSIDLLNGAAINFRSGSNLQSQSGSSFTINNGATFNFITGSVLNLGSTNTITGPTTLNANLTVLTTRVVTLNSGSDLVLNSGADLVLNSGSTLAVTNSTASNFSVSNFPTFIASKSKTVVQAASPATTQSANMVSSPIPYTVMRDTGTAGTFVARIIAPHNGATLTAVNVRLTVNTAHGGVPGTLPTITVNRVSTSGTVVNLSTSATQDFPTPVSGVAYFNSGNTQDFIYTCNINNVIDTSQFCYNIRVENESGANSQNSTEYGPIIFTYTTITSTQWSS